MDGFGSWLFLFFYGGMMWGWERVLVDLGLGRCICVLMVFEDERIGRLFGFMVRAEARFRGQLIVWQDGLYF